MELEDCVFFNSLRKRATFRTPWAKDKPLLFSFNGLYEGWVWKDECVTLTPKQLCNW